MKKRKRNKKLKDKMNLFIDKAVFDGEPGVKYPLALLMVSLEKNSKIMKVLNGILIAIGTIGLFMYGISIYLQCFRD